MKIKNWMNEKKISKLHLLTLSSRFVFVSPPLDFFLQTWATCGFCASRRVRLLVTENSLSLLTRCGLRSIDSSYDCWSPKSFAELAARRRVQIPLNYVVKGQGIARSEFFCPKWTRVFVANLFTDAFVCCIFPSISRRVQCLKILMLDAFLLS